MIARLAVVSLVVCTTIVLACGGSDDRGLFAGDGKGGTDGGYSGSGGGDGGTPSGGTSGDGGTSATGGVAGTSTGGVAGTAGVAGSVSVGGAGGSVGGAGGNTGGTGGTIAKSSIVCGDGSCGVPGNFCCQIFSWSSYTWNGTCAANGAPCSGSDITCDGPEDCNVFDECCGQIDDYAGQEYYSSFQCVQKGSCDSANQRVICGAAPSSCPGGTSCVPSSLLPGYNACAP